MGIFASIGAFLKLMLLFLSEKLERDKKRRKIKAEAFNEVKEGIKARDRSRITAGFARIKRVRK